MSAQRLSLDKVIRLVLLSSDRPVKGGEKGDAESPSLLILWVNNNVFGRARPTAT